MIDLGSYSLDFVSSTIRLSTPLLFAALGGLLSERAGVINIALEGKMLVGSFVAAVIAYQTSSPWLGFLGGGLAGLLTSAIYALATLVFRSNQIVAGTAINLLAFGIPPFVAKILYNMTGATPSIAIADRFTIAPIIIAFSVLVLMALWFKFTRSGLWVAFAGEYPEALVAAGIRPAVIRWYSVLAAGFLAGIGGATLSICLSSAYSRNMTAGRGFIALAALIVGKWKPIPAALACLLFGITEATQMRLQGVTLFGDEPVPVQFIQILPYVVTVLILAGFVGRARPPKALGTL